ncbi:hypothetical protein F3G20_27515 [Klebsiella pneumoniae]|nr:hypothetical protein F3G20_27515 [Klebsiella pneumoniae]
MRHPASRQEPALLFTARRRCACRAYGSRGHRLDRRPDKALAAIRHKDRHPLCCSPPGGAALAGPTGPAVTGWIVGRIRRSRHPA